MIQNEAEVKDQARAEDVSNGWPPWLGLLGHFLVAIETLRYFGLKGGDGEGQASFMFGIWESKISALRTKFGVKRMRFAFLPLH